MEQNRIFLWFVTLLIAFAGSLFPIRTIAQDFETEEVSTPSEADDLERAAETKAKPTGKEKKLKIQFDDELVKGQQVTPEAEYVFSRSQFNYKKMIRLRENFIPEVEKGKDEFRGKH